MPPTSGPGDLPGEDLGLATPFFFPLGYSQGALDLGAIVFSALTPPPDGSSTNPASIGQAATYRLRVLGIQSPAFGWLPAVNLWARTHSITNWSVMRNVLNLLFQARPRRSFLPNGLSPQPGTPALPAPPAPQPAPPPMPCQPANDPDQDEIGDFQDCIAANMAAIAALINQMLQQGIPIIGGGSGGDQGECCAALQAAISNGLAAIATAITNASTSSSPGQPGMDLAPVVTALTAIATALQAYPALWQALATALASNLAAIVQALTTSIGQPLSDLDLQAQKMVALQDVPQAVIDRLVAEGAISKELGQLIGGGPGGSVLSGAMGSVARFLGGEAGDALHGLGLMLINLIVPWAKAAIAAGVAAWDDFLLAYKANAGDYAGEALTLINTIGRDVEGAAGAPATAALAWILAPLKAQGPMKPGDQEAVAGTLFARAWTLGELAHLLAILGGLLPDGLGFSLSGFAAEVSLASGFREIALAIHRSWFGVGLARPTAYQANALFRSLYPTQGDATGLYARGIITAAQRDELLGFAGVRSDYTDPLIAGAYHGMQARQLIRLIETGLFTTDDIRDELTFSGMRPASQARMLLAAPYLATQTQRSQLISALESAYSAGLLADSDYTARVDSAWQNSDRDSLALAAAQLKKLVKLAADLEAEYTTLFKAGLIDDPTFRSYLSGIGLQPDYVNAVAGKAEAAANATLQRKEIATAAALSRATSAEERKAAQKGYATGTLGLPALATALIATGLTPTQAAAWTAVAALSAQGNQRWLYGLQLPPAAAAQLRARVAALTDQRKRLQITDQVYAAQLKTLGLSDTWINALQAAADAMITPKTAAFAIPIQTS